MQQTKITGSPSETEALGEALARALLKSGRCRACIALYGEMGVGKTAFTRGFARALACNAVRSPTYTVVNEYKGNPFPVFHFDLYRVADEDELYAIGFDDYLARDGYMVCEWSEHGGDLLPSDRVEVEIARVADEEEKRTVTIRSPYEDLGF
ncbi:MAG: tRNA (adenosine(37)-N6)-threonylcarbamoyltransferase complex ATPase subunit type 1 TsaE [Clostridia bacterium]|nr:tRNA (adenosine(37)-N6)-threonylcarbamoyltransferase complex ATPase subunit type 1 TsaE [Clostridia bacterium]